MFNPLEVQFAPAEMPADIPPILPEAPIPPPPVPNIAFKPEKIKKKAWSVDVVRRAQGIYPAEAQAKAAQVANAKMPTPTGAWGAPQ